MGLSFEVGDLPLKVPNPVVLLPHLQLEQSVLLGQLDVVSLLFGEAGPEHLGGAGAGDRRGRRQAQHCLANVQRPSVSTLCEERGQVGSVSQAGYGFAPLHPCRKVVVQLEQNDAQAVHVTLQREQTIKSDH